MKRKIMAGGLSALLAVGALTLAFAAPASATEATEHPCGVPWSETVNVPAQGDEFITVANPDYEEATAGTPAIWAEFSPNKSNGEFVGPPTWPNDNRGTWGVKDHLPGGHEGPDGVYQKGNGNGYGNSSWFYRQAEVKGTDAVGEPTIQVKNPEYIPATTKTVEHEATPCPPEVVQPVACTATGSWYSEDGGDPAVKPEGVVFTATGQKPGLDYRVPATGNLQGWDSLAYTATGSDQLFPRLVIDASADGGKAYQSLSFPATNPVTQDSVAYQTGKSIKQMAEQWPHAVITSVGFSMNSGATAGDTAVLTSVTSPCITRNFVVNQPKDYVEWGTWSNPEITCDNEAGDVVQQYRTNVYVTTEWKDGQWVEVRTEKATHKNHTVTQADIDALKCAVVTPPVVTPPVVTPPVVTPPVVTPPVVTPPAVNKPVVTPPPAVDKPAKPAAVVPVSQTLAQTGGTVSPWLLGVAGLLLLGGAVCTVSIGATKRNRG